MAGERSDPDGEPLRLSAAEADTAATTDFGARSLLTALETFLRQRHVEVDALTADQAVDVMLAWMRQSTNETGGAPAAADTLVYRYGGWSEGCATGFRLSLLRRAGAGDAPEQVAGITLMFEPSGGNDLIPFSTAASDWPSTAAFVEAVRRSPAYRRFAAEKPMSVMIERGGLR